MAARPLPPPARPRRPPPVPVRILPGRPAESAALDGLGYAPFRSWEAFKREVTFRQGEHITLLGRTQSGKTTLAVGGLLPMREFVAAMATKARDRALYPPLQRAGYKMTDDPRLDYRKTPRVLFKPPMGELGAIARQREGFRQVLNVIFAEGNWAVYMDEIRYLSDILGLRREIETLWLQGAALGITMIAATQEPVAIPRVAFSQIEHLFIWRLTDRERIFRAGELAGSMTDEVRAIIPLLAPHEALYVAPSRDVLLRTMYPHAL